MLPERLSNFICSLRPNEEKLTYSILFRFNNKKELVNSRIERTIIKSDQRFSYEEAQQRIETKEGSYSKEIILMHELAEKLRESRFQKGAINFDRVEVNFNLDERKTIRVFLHSKEANRLIEEFMLLANRTVAEKIGKYLKIKKPKFFLIVFMIYPSDKLDTLSEFIARFGYKLEPAEVKQPYRAL